MKEEYGDEEDASDYSSDGENGIEDELDYEGIEAGMKDQKYVDDSRINYHDYEYCVTRDNGGGVPDP